MKHYVKLSEFLSVCLQLGEHAGRVIKHVHSSGAYGATGKDAVGFEDLFTIADVTVQKTIEYNIKQLFPYVSIVSEEDNANTEHIKPTLLPD